jgi:hypothetical protein
MICSSLNLLFLIVLPLLLFAAKLSFCHVHLFGVRSRSLTSPAALIFCSFVFAFKIKCSGVVVGHCPDESLPTHLLKVSAEI